jgi:hypothetical protein
MLRAIVYMSGALSLVESLLIKVQYRLVHLAQQVTQVQLVRPVTQVQLD